MGTVHFILQGKGGVGKSFVSSSLIQFLLQKDMLVSCIDTDPVNATLASYKEFSVTMVDIMNGDNVDQRRFDDVLEMIFSAQAGQHIVIDNGASSFIPLKSYLKESQALNMLRAEGYAVYLHTVITGGQAILDTLNGLKQLCDDFPHSKIVVWLNLYFGDIVHKGKYFEDFPIYEDYKDNFHSIIQIPNKNASTYGKDVAELLARKESFAAGINSSLPLMVRQRLKTYWSEFFTAIDQGNLIPVQEESA